MFFVVFGFSSTGSAAGVAAGPFASREAAKAACVAAEASNDNPACGYWIEKAGNFQGR
jgi:hypothetical protein